MNEPPVVFAQLIDRMKEAEVPVTKRPTILGGQFDSERLAAFVAAWRVDWEKLPWRIWEHISEIKLTYAASKPGEAEPGESDLLQRGEVFGEGGHLSLRRDGNRWLWHYIGPAGQSPPEGFAKSGDGTDFWETGSSRVGTLRCYEECALLWGQKVTNAQKQPDGPYWWEDRVAAARLDYPERLRDHNHVYLTFWRFTDGGRTVFVWYSEMKGGA